MNEVRAKVESAGKIFDIKNERPPKINCNVMRLKTTTVKLPPEMYKRLCEIAIAENMPISVVIRRAIDEYLKKQIR